ncbi:hypothetical protein GMO_03810 [Gluconobacter morbifer G707]|uniref:tRNA(Ile)-lysidine synthase n=2 Tax=Gluconobacter TaxID=441 RepID=G6XFW6_9PROT|nr:hypothetical protein GMO_03810 [Gluconobacter morbifer G707]
MAPLGPWLPDVAEAPVGLAVSGGGDSMALAWLARRWRRHVVAFVVDHALRASSAEEARLTVARLEALGIRARLLTLDAFPAGRMQERAREARFAALEQACVQEGCLDLLVAHHAHDQDETVWMRCEGGSTPLGLIGMASAAIRGRLRLVRPLLSLAPERLRATLRAHDVSWIEDPSNLNRRFERVRWRQDLTERQRIDGRSLREEAVRFRREHDVVLAKLLANHARWHPAGWIFLSEEGMVPKALAPLIRLVGGAVYRPGRQQVEALCRRGVGTLGGVTVRAGGRFGRGVCLVREEQAVQGSIPAAVDVLWDRRWRFIGKSVPTGSRVSALGDGASGLDARGLGLPMAALRVLPALWLGTEVVGWPALAGQGEETLFCWAGGVPVTGETGDGL